jgi:hypothetical protein
MGVERFVFGTGQPLRLPETSVAKLDLLDLSGDDRAAIESSNAADLAQSAASESKARSSHRRSIGSRA